MYNVWQYIGEGIGGSNDFGTLNTPLINYKGNFYFSTNDDSQHDHQGTTHWYVYNPHNRITTQLADILDGWRNLRIGFSIGNKIYLGGGVDKGSTFTNAFFEYNPLSLQ